MGARPVVFSPKDLQKSIGHFAGADQATDVNGFEVPKGIPWDKVVRAHKSRLPRYAQQALRSKESPTGDRSRDLYALGAALRESKVPEKHAFVILQGLPWNKFRGRADETERILEILRKAKPSKNGHKPRTKEPWGENLFDLMAKDLGEPKYMVEGIWPSGGFGMVAGEAKTHKTWLVLDLAISVATGTPFLGRYEVHETGPVLFVEAEVRRRAMAYRGGLISSSRNALGHIEVGKDQTLAGYFRDVSPLILANSKGTFDLSSKKSVKQLYREVEATGAKMVVLDPLQNMIGGLNENSASDMRKVLLPLSRMSLKLGVAIVVVHHFRKAATDPKAGKPRAGQRAAGSQFFHGWVEAGLWVDYLNDDTVIVQREFRDFDPHGSLNVEFQITHDEYETWVQEGEPHRGVRSQAGKATPLEKFVYENPKLPVRSVAEHFGKSPKLILREARRSELIELRAGKSSDKGGRPPMLLLPKGDAV